jgi:hypothetical protein
MAGWPTSGAAVLVSLVGLVLNVVAGGLARDPRPAAAGALGRLGALVAFFALLALVWSWLVLL